MGKGKHRDYKEHTLAELCNLVATCSRPFEDLSQYIEDKAFTECIRGNLKGAVEQLTHITSSLEHIVNKNEETCRDMADVYELIGELHQYAGKFAESLPWLEKAIIVDENYDAAYHELALSYIEIGHPECAIRCLEGEISHAPDNKSAYLLLADLHRRQGNDEDYERVLSRLLERHPGEVDALHQLIEFYESQGQTVETEFLRRRLVGTLEELSPSDFRIWKQHASREQAGGQTGSSGTDPVPA